VPLAVLLGQDMPADYGRPVVDSDDARESETDGDGGAWVRGGVSSGIVGCGGSMVLTTLGGAPGGNGVLWSPEWPVRPSSTGTVTAPAAAATAMTAVTARRRRRTRCPAASTESAVSRSGGACSPRSWAKVV
jgi:hypothetical protein